MNASLLLIVPLAAAIAAAQDPGEVLAEFRLQGRPAYVTRNDVALEMAFHLRRRDEGRQAVDILVDVELTTRAAKKLGLMPTQAEVRTYWDEIAGKLRAAGRKPEDIPALRRGGPEQLFEYLAVQIAQERLVRKELDLSAREPVSADMLKLWLQEERRRSKLEVDPDALPVGVACRVDDQPVALDQLGKLLLRTCDEEELQRFVQQVAYLQSIEAMAREHGITIGDAELDRAVAARRADAASDPRFRGLGFEQLLKAQGYTVASLRELRVFRAQVMLPLLARKLTPDAQLHKRLADDRAEVLLEVGPRRRIGMIFTRALDQPNAFVPLDFPAAIAHLQAVRARLAKDEFELVARIESEEPASKQRGGDLGWRNRRDEGLPDVVLQSAFELGAGEVSQPLQGDSGCYLVKVLEIEPDLDDEQLLRRLRERTADELKSKILKDLELQPRTTEGGK